MTQDPEYKEMLKAARKADACVEMYRRFARYRRLEGAAKDERAPEAAYWYARNVIKGA